MKVLKLSVVVLALAVFVIAGVAQAGETLDAVKARGYVIAGVNGGVLGKRQHVQHGGPDMLRPAFGEGDLGRLLAVGHGASAGCRGHDNTLCGSELRHG